MKSWMKSLVVPAVAGALYAGPAFAKDATALANEDALNARANRAQTELGGDQLSAAQVEREASIAAKGDAARVHIVAGDAREDSTGAPIVAAPAEKARTDRTYMQQQVDKLNDAVTDKRFHAQTQFQQAAQGTGAIDRTGEAVQRDSNTRSSAPAAAQSQSKLAQVMKNPGKIALEDQRPHFSAQQSEELGAGSVQPAEDRTNDSRSHGSSQASSAGVSKGAERAHFSAQQLGELRPEGDNHGADRDLGARSGLSMNLERNMREPKEVHVPSLHFDRPEKFKAPQAFYR